MNEVALPPPSPRPSTDLEIVVWPPRLGARIHWNSGWATTSWTAEVRAIVDDEVAVIWKTVPVYGHSRYELMDRIQVMVSGDYGRPTGGLRYGPLPKELCQKEGPCR